MKLVYHKLAASTLLLLMQLLRFVVKKKTVVATVAMMQFCSCGVADEVVVGEEMLELWHRWMFLLIQLSICWVLKCCCHHKC